jgi:hypothetical protein
MRTYILLFVIFVSGKLHCQSLNTVLILSSSVFLCCKDTSSFLDYSSQSHISLYKNRIQPPHLESSCPRLLTLGIAPPPPLQGTVPPSPSGDSCLLCIRWEAVGNRGATIMPTYWDGLHSSGSKIDFHRQAVPESEVLLREFKPAYSVGRSGVKGGYDS